MPAATLRGSFLKAQTVVYNYEGDGVPYLEIECADGSFFRFSLFGLTNHVKLESLKPKTAQLISDYAMGHVTLAHVREALGLAAPKTELDIFAEAALKTLTRLASDLLSTHENTLVDDDPDEPEFSEEDSDESVYLTLPSTVSETTILRLLEEIRSSPSTAGKQITINISKEGHEPRYFNTAGSNLSTE